MSKNNMNRTPLTVLLLCCTLLGLHAAKVKNPARGTYIYRYYLTDKQASTLSIDKPQRFLSRKSLDRRQHQGLQLDSTDLPVPRQYVRQFAVKGTEVLGTSRWQNTVVVRSTDTLLLRRLAALPIVRDWRCVYVAPDSINRDEDIRWNVHETFNRWDSVKNDPYGMAREQIEMLGGIRMHEAGLTGQGITIAIIDGGFQNYDRIPALRQTRIAGVRDFVEPANTQPERMAESPYPTRGTSFQLIDHGTKVFSAIAAMAPEVTMGTAPDATFWLLRSEENATEQPVEEDYWVMAAEFADSVGVDIISSSLGYNEYDGGLGSYRLQDLNGQTALISRTASLLARKGIVLCNSAGNSGMQTWKKIGVPADANDILTVGAVAKNGKIATFSSVGPSQDGRVKPDVVALDSPTALINGKGMLSHNMGTSFSTPLISGLVACLWQGLRQKTALEIIELVRRSTLQYEEPDNIYGYGTPDFWRAYMVGQTK